MSETARNMQWLSNEGQKTNQKERKCGLDYQLNPFDHCWMGNSIQIVEKMATITPWRNQSWKFTTIEAFKTAEQRENILVIFSDFPDPPLSIDTWICPSDDLRIRDEENILLL